MGTERLSPFLCRNKPLFFFQHLTNSFAYPTYNKSIIEKGRRWNVYYELYIDVFFLVNFMMDYILLSLVKKMLKCPATHGSICIGAVAGALCTCVVMIIPGMNAFIKFILFHGIGSILMIKTGLKIRWNKTFLKAYILLYISAFLVGGVMGAFRQYMRSASLFFALAAAGYSLSLGIWNLLSYLAERNVRRCKARLIKGGRECTLEALIDTGNKLRDNITGKPVSIISGETAKKLGIMCGTPQDGGEEAQIRYIPYHSIGKAEGVMPAVALDRMCICRGQEIWIEKPIVAICEEYITTDDYEMLMSPDLL